MSSGGTRPESGPAATPERLTPDLVRVVRGDVDETELAALVAGIVATRLAGEHEEIDDGSHTSVWGDPRRRWGVPARPSRAAWRWSTHQAW